MELNITQMLTSLSFALDYLEIDVKKNVTNHNKRLAHIAGSIGRTYGFSEEELSDLYAYSLLHDNGFASGTGKEHCISGENNIDEYPFFEKSENIIKYHHEKYDGTGFFGITGEDIPIFSQIIHIADYSEDLYRQAVTPKEIKRKLEKVSEEYFSKELIDAFNKTTMGSDFWTGLDNLLLEKTYTKKIPKVHITHDYATLIEVAKTYVKVSDGKSYYMAGHSEGLASKIATICNYYGFDEKKSDKMILAAQLHDIGRLIIPTTILDKPERLTSDEYNQVKYHSFYTRKALETIPYFEEITEWAANHHEKLNGGGYPLGLDENSLDFESKIMACLDIYQALTENRSYRNGMPHNEAINIMLTMADNQELKKSIIIDIKEIFFTDF